jgi:hypothetical protein
LAILRAAEDFVETSERLAGRIEQGPIVRRDLDITADALLPMAFVTLFRLELTPKVSPHVSIV